MFNGAKVTRTASLAAAVSLLAGFLALCSCGDESLVSVTGTGRLQGVWEGEMTLSATAGDTLAQKSRLRLELIQQDFSFEGLLLKIDPLASGFGEAPVDTFVVKHGTVSNSFISFEALDPLGGAAVFEGEIGDRLIEGSVLTTGYTGDWNVRFLF